jgi:hypothetical protein
MVRSSAAGRIGGVSFLLACSLVLGLFAACYASTGPTAEQDKPGGAKKEQTVTLDQLPAAAKGTLTKEAGTGKIQEIEKRTKGDTTVFEADVIVDGKKWEITVRQDGQLLKKELDEEEDEEDDEEDN